MESWQGFPERRRRSNDEYSGYQRGSSSFSYQLLNPGDWRVAGCMARASASASTARSPPGIEGKQVLDAVDVAMPTHSEAIQAVLNALVDKDNGVIGSMKEIDAVGHRVVHGGEAFNKSVLITDEVMKALEDCIPLAPLHNPANITGINACTAVMGKDVPQVAVFDTAFHQTMPAKAYMLLLPHEIMRMTRSATRITAPLISMSLSALPLCWARSLRS